MRLQIMEHVAEKNGVGLEDIVRDAIKEHLH
jgi:hypothetical protein